MHWKGHLWQGCSTYLHGEASCSVRHQGTKLCLHQLSCMPCQHTGRCLSSVVQAAHCTCSMPQYNELTLPLGHC
jgi:hypothetical protein